MQTKNKNFLFSILILISSAIAKTLYIFLSVCSTYYSITLFVCIKVIACVSASSMSLNMYKGACVYVFIYYNCKYLFCTHFHFNIVLPFSFFVSFFLIFCFVVGFAFLIQLLAFNLLSSQSKQIKLMNVCNENLTIEKQKKEILIGKSNMYVYIVALYLLYLLYL